MTQRGERWAWLRSIGALVFVLGASASIVVAEPHDGARPHHPERRGKEPLECRAAIGQTDYGYVQAICGCGPLCERGLAGGTASQLCRAAGRRISQRLPSGMTAASSSTGGVCTIEIPIDALVVNRSGRDPLSIFCQRHPENASVIVRLQEIRQPDAACTCEGATGSSDVVGSVAVLSFTGRHRCRDGHVHTISDALSELHAEDSAALVRHVWRSIDAALRGESIQPYRLSECIDKHPTD